MIENPTVHRNVTIRKSSITVTDSDTTRTVEKFHARVYQTKDTKRKNIPVEADTLKEIKQKIDAILDA